MGIFDGLKGYFALKKWQRTELGQALHQHTMEYFHGDTLLQSFKQENKESLVMDFYGKVFALSQSENWLIELRERLTEAVLLYTHLQVLCLTKEEKADTFYSGSPYVSGQLYRHISEAAQFHDELAQIQWENDGLTDEDLISAANTRSVLYLYYLNGWNIVRVALEGTTPKPWFRPFIEARLISEEAHYREKLRLPSLLKGPEDGLIYGSFMNYVLPGRPNPLFEWSKDWPEYCLASEGAAAGY